MAKYGLLVDAQWCSGCHSCEIACQMEHGLPVGQTGIKVVKIGRGSSATRPTRTGSSATCPFPRSSATRARSAAAWARCPPACSIASPSAWSSASCPSSRSAWTRSRRRCSWWRRRGIAAGSPLRGRGRAGERTCHRLARPHRSLGPRGFPGISRRFCAPADGAHRLRFRLAVVPMGLSATKSGYAAGERRDPGRGN